MALTFLGAFDDNKFVGMLALTIHKRRSTESNPHGTEVSLAVFCVLNFRLFLRVPLIRSYELSSQGENLVLMRGRCVARVARSKEVPIFECVRLNALQTFLPFEAREFPRYLSLKTKQRLTHRMGSAGHYVHM